MSQKFLKPHKHFGQHFLHDEFFLKQMIDAINISEKDYIVEIGPGHGALTKYLLPLSQTLDLIEIDYNLVEVLKKKFGHYSQMTIHNQDVLHFDFNKLNHSHLLRLVGNLPYNITTPLLFKLFSYIKQIQDMHFLIQKEVGDRLTAQVNSSQYGRLTVMAQYYCKIESLFSIGPEAFTPIPKVNSSFVRFTPNKVPIFIKNHAIFSEIVKQAFNYRRKTIHNSLKNLLTDNDLVNLGIDPHKRPQQLTIDEFVKISNIIDN